MKAFGVRDSNKRDQKNMGLMSAICSADYNQPNNRSTSLKVTSRTQSNSINKASQMAHTGCSLERLPSHRISDYFNCCEKRILTRKGLGRGMCWEGILVFSVIVLINVASINCTATRQVEGEFMVHSLPYTLSLLIFMTLNSDLFFSFSFLRLCL